MDGVIYILEKRHDIYVHNLCDEYDIIINKSVYVTLVGQNNFMLMDIKRTEQTREFARKLVNPSNDVPKSMVRFGAWLIVHLLSAISIMLIFKLGISQANIKGKTTSHKLTIVELMIIE